MIAILINHAGGVLVWRNIIHGDLGTDLFLIMSGIALAIGRNADLSPVEFIKRRLVRILPAYWIVFTAYLLLDRWLLQRELPWQNIVVHYLGAHSLFGDAYAFAVNDSFWFVTAILGCYGFFIATRSLLDKRPDRVLLIGAILSLFVISIVNYYGQGGLMGRLGFRMADFTFGMLVGNALRKRELNLPLTSTLGLSVLIYFYLPYTQSVVLYSTAVACAVIAFYTLTVRRFTRDGQGPKWLAFLGEHSLEIFLIHQPLMREFNRYALARWCGANEASDGLVLFGIIISVGVTLVLAVELHRITKALSNFLFRQKGNGSRHLVPEFDGTLRRSFPAPAHQALSTPQRRATPSFSTREPVESISGHRPS